MATVCAWCQTLMKGTLEEAEAAACMGQITHGCCEECLTWVMAEAAVALPAEPMAR